VQRLDQVLKSMEGITQEMVDKVIALGLIDVRDIEEVGTGPLMEELGLTEELAQTIVDRCADEAKLVAAEQEAKKAADARAKAADAAALSTAGMKGVDGVAFASPMLPQTAAAAVTTEEAITAGGDDAGRMPLAMEATEGIAPELTTHSEATFAGGRSELSPEERAISGVEEGSASGDQASEAGRDDENEETAALAEGRLAPPASGDQA
jgi:hypothetical protein